MNRLYRLGKYTDNGDAMKVLIIDDDCKIVDILQAYLKKENYDVYTAEDGEQGLAMVASESPDIILLDVMMPKMDGWEVCREVRKISAIPIIMLTAKDEEKDRINGLDIGADDYVVKPFSPREVMARIRAIARRMHGMDSDAHTASTLAATTEGTQNTIKNENVLIMGPLVLSKLSRDVVANGDTIILTPTEFKLLELFMTHPGRVFSRSHLLQVVQDISFDGYDRTIDSHIKNLRKKLDAPLEAPYMIKTVYGVGYKMTGEPHA